MFSFCNKKFENRYKINNKLDYSDIYLFHKTMYKLHI